MTPFRLRIMAQVLPFLLIAPALAPAQTPPTRSHATAALNQPNQANPANPAAAHYTRQQIDQMVAPIALYPDQLLAQVMMAATYPQQIVEAAEWLKDPNNTQLKGDALVAALQPLPWDPSVKALVAFPQIVAMMNDHVEWTEALGVAFATQQAEVMTRVQALRHLAFKSGRLNKLRHLAVRQEGPAIVIAPSEPDQVLSRYTTRSSLTATGLTAISRRFSFPHRPTSLPKRLNPASRSARALASSRRSGAGADRIGAPTGSRSTASGLPASAAM